MTGIRDERDVATEAAGGWRSLLPGGTFFPFAILLIVYFAFDLVAPCVLRVANGRLASPYHFDMSVDDGLGGSFGISDMRSEWGTGLFTATVFSTGAQRAIFAAWIAFGGGRWLIRLGIATIACVCLYGMIQVQLSVPFESWRQVFAPFAVMPLQILSAVTPLAIVAVLTGWRLQHKGTAVASAYSKRRFSIADILLITALVAVSVALASWKDATRAEDANAPLESVVSALGCLAFSTIYVLPVACSTLAVHRNLRAMLLAGLLTATPAALLLLAGAGDSELWPMQIGFVCGVFLTATCSLLLWRLCGYRLVRIRHDDAR